MYVFNLDKLSGQQSMLILKDWRENLKEMFGKKVC